MVKKTKLVTEHEHIDTYCTDVAPTSSYTFGHKHSKLASLMSFQHLSCEQLQSWINETGRVVTLVDIRDPQSFVTGHIPGAILIDNSNVQKFIEEADHQLPLVVCCYHGNSSQSAADFFNQQGFTDCYSLDGGYEAWRQMNNAERA